MSVPAAPVTIAENSTILYQITARNTGAGAATNFRVIDTFPATFTYDGTYQSTYSLNGGAPVNINPTVLGNQATWTFASFAGNSATLVITFRARSGTGAASRGTWTNQVDSLANNAVNATTGPTAPVSVITPITLTVTKTITAPLPQPAAYAPGTDFTYRIRITNPTAAAAQNVRVVDDLPGGTGWAYDSGSTPTYGNPDVTGNELFGTLSATSLPGRPWTFSSRSPRR